MSIEPFEDYLRTAPILHVSTFGQHGAHPSFRLTLEGGVATLAKPSSRAPDDGAAMVRYEVAGWELAKALGWTDLVSTTVMRTTNEVTGIMEEMSLQVLWPEYQPSIDISSVPDDDVWRAAIFDVVALHCDRSANWGGVEGRLKLVDHGYAFRAWPGRPFTSAFEAQKRGQHIDDEYYMALTGLDEDTLAGVAELLENDVLEQLAQRVEHLTDTRVLSLP